MSKLWEIGKSFVGKTEYAAEVRRLATEQGYNPEQVQEIVMGFNASRHIEGKPGRVRI